MDNYEVTSIELLGYIGGMVLAVALVPQVYASFKSWSTADLSYGWQCVYILGLLLNFVYFVLVDAVAAWVTLCIEIFFALLLFGLKLKIDGCKSRASANVESGVRMSVERTTSGQIAMNQIGQITRKVSFGQSMGRLKVGDAFKLARRPSVKSGDLVSDVYRGFHYTVDATFTKVLPAGFGNDMMAAMLEAAKNNNVRAVNHMIEIFDGSDSPPGWASAVLIDESHMSSHCYSDQGMLAFDCFTCGANPEGTRAVTATVIDFLKEHLGDDARIDVGHMPRFPVRKASRPSDPKAIGNNESSGSLPVSC